MSAVLLSMGLLECSGSSICAAQPCADGTSEYCTEGCCLCHLNVSLSFSLPHHKGELQRSCSRTVAEKVSEQCQLACHCRRYPPLPPPPPPPPPPRLLSTTGKIPSLASHLSHFNAACLTLSLLSLHSWTPHLTQVSAC